MNIEKYNAIFREEVEKAGLESKKLEWRFVQGESYYYYKSKMIDIGKYGRSNLPGLWTFRQLVRHELYHAKGGRNEIMAILCEYVPCLLRR